MQTIHIPHHKRHTFLHSRIIKFLNILFFTFFIGGPLHAQTIGNERGYFCNPPLPYLPYKLDVLFIGNSFSIDTGTALPALLRSSKLSTVAVYVLYKGGCSMKQHYEYYKNNEPVYELWLYDSRGEKKLENKITIRNAMKRYAYDVVVFQQYSLESGNYDSYEPYLSKILQAYKLTTISPRTTFAFNQTWAYSSKHKDLKRYGTQEDMWRSICQASNEMKQKSGIDIIIPCGTAVQNARTLTSVTTDDHRPLLQCEPKRRPHHVWEEGTRHRERHQPPSDTELCQTRCCQQLQHQRIRQRVNSLKH